MGACCASLLGGSKDGGVELQAQPRYKIGIPESCRGSKVEVSQDLTITGTGAALASAAIEQDAAYWEVKVVKMGTIRLGVARKLQSTELDAGIAASTSPSDGSGKAWCLDSTSPGVTLEEGDIIGVAFGQSDLPNLSFRKNGKDLHSQSVNKIKATVYPVVSLADGAVVQVIFEEKDLSQPKPSGQNFQPLMEVRSIL